MPLTRLSCRLTFLYKVIIPIATLLSWITYVGLIVTQEWLLELHAIVAGFLLFLWLLFTLMAVRLRYIYYDAETVRIRNYGPWITMPAAKVLDFEASWLGPLRFMRTSARNFYFLPSYLDTLAAAWRDNPILFGFTEPSSIAKVRVILRLSPASGSK